MGKESQSVGVRASNRESPWPGDPGLFFPLPAASGAGQQARPHIVQPHLLASHLTKHSSLGSSSRKRIYQATAGPSQGKKKIFLLPVDHSEPDQLALAAGNDNHTISSREEAVKLKRTRMAPLPLICPHEYQCCGRRQAYGEVAHCRRLRTSPRHMAMHSAIHHRLEYCWPGWASCRAPRPQWALFQLLRVLVR